jgi:predicted small secreted protein
MLGHCVNIQQRRTSMKTQLIVMTALVAASLSLAACGETKGDRALSGAGIGAGVGMLGAAVTGGSGVTGALVGGAAGAAAGGLTKKDDINLGKPAWR